jgi:hypothetical protein
MSWGWWVLIFVVAGCAIAYGLIELYDAMVDRRHRNIVGAEHIDVAKLRGAFPPAEPPSNVFVVDWRERVPYDQDADET